MPRVSTCAVVYLFTPSDEYLQMQVSCVYNAAMPTHDSLSPGDLLRAKGLKATPQRIKLISHLGSFSKPVSASEIRETWEKGDIDAVTLYRALDALVSASIVRRVDLQHGHTDYELNQPHNHHHHLVCTECGATEDVRECPAERLEKQALRKSHHFATLKEHALEFFGTCKTCAS